MDSDDASLLRALNDYGELLAAQGELARAHEIETRLIAPMVSRYGESHPQTLVVMGNVARKRVALGDVAGTLTLVEQILARAAGQDTRHPATLMAMTNCASILLGLGDLARAVPLLEMVVGERRTRAETSTRRRCKR